MSDEAIFREGVLNIENVDLFGQQFGGSLRDINIKGVIQDGLWKGLELNVDTNLATPELKLVAQTRDKDYDGRTYERITRNRRKVLEEHIHL